MVRVSERLTETVRDGDEGGSAVSQALAGVGRLRRDTLVLDELKPVGEKSKALRIYHQRAGAER